MCASNMGKANALFLCSTNGMKNSSIAYRIKQQFGVISHKSKAIATSIEAMSYAVKIKVIAAALTNSIKVIVTE